MCTCSCHLATPGASVAHASAPTVKLSDVKEVSCLLTRVWHPLLCCNGHKTHIGSGHLRRTQVIKCESEDSDIPRHDSLDDTD